jgi:hypothetical protein
VTSVNPAQGAIGLAAEYFAAATAYLIAGAIGLVWIAPELAAGAFASPHVAGVTHLFTLGWLTTTIFGALCQLLPVAMGSPIRSSRIAHAAFWTFAPGAGLFAAGIAASSTFANHAGVALVTIGVLLMVGNVAATLPRARSKDVTWAALALAISFLASTLVLGVVLLHNMHTGFIAAARIRVLSTHLHVALVGWALITMAGVSHRLLPMFMLAHGADTRWTKPSVFLLAAGVLALAAGLLAQLSAAAWTGVTLLEAGVGCFLWQASAFYRTRVRKKIDIGMRFAITALGFLAAAAALGPFVLADHVAHPRLATAYVTIGLLGGIVLFVTGFLYKIVPLLAWTARYRARMGKGAVPTVADTFSARVAGIQLVVMSAAVVLLATGIAVSSPHVARCGAVLYLAGALLFASQLVRVSFGNRSL